MRFCRANYQSNTAMRMPAIKLYKHSGAIVKCSSELQSWRCYRLVFQTGLAIFRFFV